MIRFLARLLLHLLLAALLLGGVVAGGAAWVWRSDAGRAWLDRALSLVLSGSPDLSVQVSGFDLRLRPLEIAVRELRLADCQGLWLELAAARAALDLQGWRSNDFRVAQLQAQAAVFTRPPVFSSAEDAPVASWRLQVERAVCESFTFNLPGEAAQGRLEISGVSEYPMRQTWACTWREGHPVPSALDASLEWVPAQETLLLALDYQEAAQGRVARWLQITNAAPLAVQLKGRGPLAHWMGQGACQLAGVWDVAATGALSTNAHGSTQLQMAARHATLLDGCSLHAAVAASNLFEAPQGTVACTGHYARGEASARSGFQWAAGQLSLENLEAILLTNLVARGHLTMAFQPWQADGVVTATVAHLSMLTNWVAIDLDGRAEAVVELVRRDGAMALRAQGTAGLSTSAWGSVDAAPFKLDWYPLDARGAGNLWVRLRHWQVAGVCASNVQLEAQGTLKRGIFEVQGDGMAGYPVALRVAGAFTRTLPGAWQMDLSQVAGAYGVLPFKLREPVVFRQGPAGWRLSPFELAAGEAAISGYVSHVSQQWDLALQVDRFPCAAVQGFGGPALSGQLSGRLEARGALANPVLQASLVLTNFQSLAWPLALQQEPVHATAVLQLSNYVVAARAEAQGPFAMTANGRLDGRWDIPTNSYNWPLQSLTELNAQVEAHADLNRFAAGFDWDDRTLGGQLVLQASLRGSYLKPRLRGALSLTNGYFTHLPLGIVLRDIQVRIRGDEQSLQVVEARVRDNQKGRMNLSGSLRLDPKEHFPLEVQATLQDFAPLSWDLLQAGSDGRLYLTGTVQRLVLGGELTLPKVDFTIPDQLPPEIVVFDVIELNRPAAPAPPRVGAKPVLPPLLAETRLALAVRAPRRVFIRGRGLDSEWNMHLAVKGVLAAPQVAGAVRLVRGSMRFMNRKLTLGDSRVTFSGEYPPVPQLSIEASATSGDMTAELAVLGPYNAPQWLLTSTPAYPEEEVLSRLIFGRSMDRLSALEALRIANGLSSMKGGGKTFDVMGRVQNFLTVDQFDISSYSRNSAQQAVSMGKYLSSNIYLEGEKTIQGTDGDLKLQLGLTPSLLLETFTGTGNRDGINLRWNYDY